VRAAVDEGTLDHARLESYRKLSAELRALEVREDPVRRRAELGRYRAAFKAQRKPKRG
jgi:hypothetical protein